LDGVSDKQLLAESQKKQAQIMTNVLSRKLAQLFIDFDEELNLTGLFAELFHFMLHLPSKAINTRHFTLMLAVMKFRD